MNKRKRKAEKLLREELEIRGRQKELKWKHSPEKKKASIFLCEVETVIKMKASKLVLFIHHTLVNEKFMDGLN